jgi:hypothetical protein
MFKWAKWGIGGALLLLLFARLLFGAEQLSITADEPSHLASGYALLARGKDGLWTLSQRGHPLGVDAWLALPLWIGQPDVPLEDLSGWQTDYSAYLSAFWTYVERQEGIVLAARAQATALALLLAAIVWRWGRDLWGPWAGLLALGVLAFDPTLIAHGRLATNDVGVTVLGTCALYAIWRWSERPNWRKAVAAAILMALTMLAKGSGILWVAVGGTTMLVIGVLRWRQEGGPRPVLQAVLAGSLSLFLLWAAYGFSWGRVGDGDLWLPAAAHWEGSFYHSQIVGQRLVFALGHRTYGRWWWYFPLTFGIKNPLPLLIALVIGVIVLLLHSRRRSLWPLAVFPVAYAAVAVTLGENIGHRYLLPLYPFVFLAIGGGLSTLLAAGSAQTWPRWTRGICSVSLGVLAAWYVVAGAAIYPYEIAYFNELVGGPEKGYRYLVDSNLAWGQADALQQEYVRAHPEVQDEPPPSKYRPAPGSYLVDASYLQGVGIGDPFAYEWFRHREPSQVLGYSKLVYDVPEREIAWVAQCSVPRVPLDDVDIYRGVGQADLRVVTFDCTRGWLVPEGCSGGLYVLHHDLFSQEGHVFHSLAPTDPFVASTLAWADLSFDQPSGNEGQPFVIFEALSRAPGSEPPPDREMPVLLRGPKGQEPPISLAGPVSLLNVVVRREKDDLEVDTIWRVTEGPVTRPFSIMGHLVSAEGMLIEGVDGLGVSPLALVPGDLYIHRHRFSSNPSEPVQFETGAYWLDTMAQWPVLDTSVAQALSFELH